MEREAATVWFHDGIDRDRGVRPAAAPVIELLGCASIPP